MSTSEGNELGRRGEDAAAAYLENAGMIIAERNWRCRAGEMDIIAWDGRVLVMCEVKTRRSVAKGTPEEAVTAAKRRKISRLAASYVATLESEPDAVRFDVVALLVLGPDRALLRHHRHAFDLAG